MCTIEIAKDFGLTLDGRTRDSGPRSAEAFRDDLLVPALRRQEHVRVVVDGPAYSMAFLDEAFAGIVRNGYMSRDDLKCRLEIVAGLGYRYTKKAIERYIDQSPSELSALR